MTILIFSYFQLIISKYLDNIKIQYEKQNYIILTQYYIIRIIENILNKNVNDLNKHKFNNKNKYIVKHNTSLMIEGLKKNKS